VPTEIVNEALVKSNMDRRDALDRFKRKTLLDHSRAFTELLDYGCGSGKFLYQNQDLFIRCHGVEVNQKCLEFAQMELKLAVSDHFPSGIHPSTVSFWHSMEHLPYSHIRDTLKIIHQMGDEQIRLIISVPAADSTLHQLLRENDPYYDPSAHIHEFTSNSLERLLRDSGFTMDRQIFSLPYSLFGWAQGLSNLLHPVRNYFYYRFRRGNSVSPNFLRDIWAMILFTASLPLAVLFTLLEKLVVFRSSVLTVVAYRTQT